MAEPPPACDCSIMPTGGIGQRIDYCPMHKAAPAMLAALGKLTKSIKLVAGTIGETWYSVDEAAKLEATELLHQIAQARDQGAEA